VGLVFGAFLLGSGAIIRYLASPSPHGFVETFLAAPLSVLGAVIFGLTVVVNWARLSRLQHFLGIGAIIYGGYIAWVSAHFWAHLIK
jgi:hypothetical protein